jgi:hypothetical protein
MGGEQAGPLLETVVSAQERHQEYAQVKMLTTAAECLAEYAISTGAAWLVAASPLAERVIGAAILLAGGRLEGAAFRDADQPGDPLVVDVAVTSVLGIRAAETRAWAAGATRVRSVVLDPLPLGELRFPGSEVDHVELLPV